MDVRFLTRESSAVDVKVGPYLVDIADAATFETARVGAKARNLGRLMAAGFAVPGGFVLTADAFREHLATLPTVLTPSTIAEWTLSESIDEALQEVCTRLGDVPFAVRSSAVAEDALDASFAGLFESVLDVRGLPAVRDAVLRCWVSALGDDVMTYSRGGLIPGLAVIVQPMILADAAGIAFTADPMSGCTDHAIVTAVPGSGAALAAGEVDGDDWIVDAKGHAIARNAERQALTAEQATAVAVLARRVESTLGGPQDVEWALAEGRIVILQARPITALPRKPEGVLPPGLVWMKDGDRYPEGMSGLGASLVPGLVADGLTTTFAEYGALISDVSAQCVGGEFYISFATPGRPGMPPPPALLLGALVRLNPEWRRRCARAKERANPDALRCERIRWDEEWRPRFERRVALLARVALEELPDQELKSHLEAVLDFGRSAMAVHFHLTPAELVPVFELASACRRWLGWDETHALDLVAGASPTTTAPSRELAAIVSRLTGRQRAALSAVGPERIVGALAGAAPSAAADFEEWRTTFALRTLNDDPGSPTLIEEPTALGRLVFEALHATSSGTRSPQEAGERAREEAQRRLAPRPRRARKFELLLQNARDAYRLREDVAFWTGSVFGGLLRRATLEVGRRSVARGQLGRREDAAQLDAATLCRAIDAEGPDLRSVVARAHSERAWTRQHPGPEIIGAASRPPKFRWLPRRARVLNSALAWSRGTAESSRPNGGRSLLTGVAASPGSHLGRVRVVHGVSEFAAVRSGEVLVCPTTDPAWSVLFGVAGALVTDTGGLLSHAAIIAREHGLPAVLATGTGTHVLRDGMLVTVDGSTGHVLVHAPKT